MNPTIAGGLINAALYLLLVGAASIADANHGAVTGTILSAALAVCGYMAQSGDKRHPIVAWLLYLGSNAAALVAGLLLVRGYFF